jgi:hypothetical protein
MEDTEMVEMSFTHIPAPSVKDRSEEHYRNGWNFADDAIGRYGQETCNGMRKRMQITSSYERGAADRFDGKPHKYGKDTA